MATALRARRWGHRATTFLPPAAARVSLVPVASHRLSTGSDGCST